MKYYVNLYLAPESLPLAHQDNIKIGWLCRSREEAMKEAINRQFFRPEAKRQEYVGTLNDPFATNYIRASLKEAAAGIADMKYNLIPVPEDFDDFEEAYRAYKNAPDQSFKCARE